MSRVLPEREKVLDILHDAGSGDRSDDASAFLDLAIIALRGVESHRGKGEGSGGEQGIVNGVTIAFLALGKILGIGELSEAIALGEPPQGTLAAAKADERLDALYAEWRGHFDASFPALDDEEIDRLTDIGCARMVAIEREVAATPARTARGLLAKVRLSVTLAAEMGPRHDPETDEIDETLDVMGSLIADLEHLARAG